MPMVPFISRWNVWIHAVSKFTGPILDPRGYGSHWIPTDPAGSDWIHGACGPMGSHWIHCECGPNGPTGLPWPAGRRILLDCRDLLLRYYIPGILLCMVPLDPNGSYGIPLRIPTDPNGSQRIPTDPHGSARIPTDPHASPRIPTDPN